MGKRKIGGLIFLFVILLLSSIFSFLVTRENFTTIQRECEDGYTLNPHSSMCQPSTPIYPTSIEGTPKYTCLDDNYKYVEPDVNNKNEIGTCVSKNPNNNSTKSNPTPVHNIKYTCPQGYFVDFNKAGTDRVCAKNPKPCPSGYSLANFGFECKSNT